MIIIINDGNVDNDIDDADSGCRGPLFEYLEIWLFGFLAIWLFGCVRCAMSMAKWGIPEKSIKNSSEGLTLGLHEAPIFFWN